MWRLTVTSMLPDFRNGTSLPTFKSQLQTTLSCFGAETREAKVEYGEFLEPNTVSTESGNEVSPPPS